jgi:uncharacterized membrane protein
MRSEQDGVVIAGFDSDRHAEHMFASLGRGFRKKARKDGTTAVVVRGNADASLKLTQSRVLTASGWLATLIGVTFSWTVGFVGLGSMLKGARARPTPCTSVKGTSDRMSSRPTRSSPKPAGTRPSR